MTTTSGCVGVDRGDDRLELHLGQQLDRRVDEARRCARSATCSTDSSPVT